MTQPQRNLLARGYDLTRSETAGIKHGHVLAAFLHRRFQFERDVEMFDDRGLAAAGHEDHLLDPRLPCFVHRILDERAVDDRQQFLRNGLGRRKEPRAQPGDGKDGFFDGFMRLSWPIE